MNLTLEDPGVATALAAIERSSRSTGVSPRLILSGNRTSLVSLARHLAMALTRAATTMSLHEIGDLYKRDHSAIIHACKKIADRRAIDPGFDRFFIRALADITKP